MPMTLEDIAHATGGRLIGASRETVFRRVSTDTRTLDPGDLFVALKGKTHDGHRFIDDALAKGAAGLIASENAARSISKDKVNIDNTVIVAVADTLRAYQALAAEARRGMAATVVAVTGSTGKTTVKDMLACITSLKRRTSASPRNFNNEIGVPATILDAPDDTEVLILEVAMRGPGQIKELAEIGRPDIGVVLNVGLTHYELLGSESAIAEAKAELLEGMDEASTLVVNRDDKQAHAIAARAKGRVVTFGVSHEADVRAEHIGIRRDGTPYFILCSRLPEVSGSIAADVPVPGRHNVENALAAGAVALLLGMSLEDVAGGLRASRISALRMEVIRAAAVTIINDTYNASPASMAAALETLADMARRAASGEATRSAAVLGDMLELGDISETSHKEIGRQVAALGIDVLVTIGRKSASIAEGALAAGMKPEQVRSFPTLEAAQAGLQSVLAGSEYVLVKASRAMGLERIVDQIVNSE